jgi:hypothetical protein
MGLTLLSPCDEEVHYLIDEDDDGDDYAIRPDS